MPKFIFAFFGLLILSVWYHSSSAQELYYTVDMRGKEIGKIKAIITQTPNSKTFTVLSEVNFKVLWKKYQRISNNYVVYENDNLVEIFAGVYINNDLEDSVTLTHDGETYYSYRHPDESLPITDPSVNFASIELYFSEPVGIEKIYSEQHLTYCPLEKYDSHKYKLLLPNGDFNTYTYEDSQLVEVVVDRTWFDLKFIKAN